MNALSFIWSFRFPLAVLALFITVPLYGMYREHIGYTRGIDEATSACNARILKAKQEGDKRYAQAVKKVSKMRDDDLRRELCKWVRDADPDVCFKNLAPFR